MELTHQPPRSHGAVAGATHPGPAPEPEGVAPAAQRRRSATSRSLWVACLALIGTLMVLRIPLTYEYVTQRVPPEFSAEIGDEQMEALALRVAVFVGFALTLLIITCYFVLAAVLEKRLFPAAKRIGGATVGLYFLVVTMCVVPPQVVSLVLRVPNPRGSPWYFIYIAVVAGALPWLYRTAWQDRTRKRRLAIFLASYGIAILTVLG